MNAIKNIQLGKYRHFKGKEYQVIGIAHHSETLEPMIVYKALYYSEPFGENALWVRPFDMFFESVEFEGKKVQRFAFMEE